MNFDVIKLHGTTIKKMKCCVGNKNEIEATSYGIITTNLIISVMAQN